MKASLVARALSGVLAILGLIGPSHMNAQLLEGTIDGNVRDQADAAIVGATVVTKNQQTGAIREAKTNGAGGYNIPTLQPGTYTVTVSAPGLATYTQTGVAVTLNTVVRVDVTLAIGQVNQSVTVEAQTAGLQTDRADVKAELTTQTLTNIPVIRRNYQMMLQTLPGFSPPQATNTFAANPSRAVQFNVNGNAVNANNVRIDGTLNMNVNVSTLPSYTPPLEAIETVNVVTNSFDAEQGTVGGAAVNLLVKTGTNAIHGVLFEDHTDQHTIAYGWAADRTQPKPKFIYNQYGGAVGGPIKKDKLFYFFDYEGTRDREDSQVVLEVPTAAMKTGNLSASPTAIYDPMTGNANGTGRIPFQGKIIPPSRIDIGVKNIIDTGLWANPNQAGSGAYGLSRNYQASGPNGVWRDQFDGKLNWNVSSKLTAFTRFSYLNSANQNASAFGNLGGPGFSANNTVVGYGFGHVLSGTAGATYVFSSNLVFDSYYGYVRNNPFARVVAGNQGALGSTVMQVPGLQPVPNIPNSAFLSGGWPFITIDGFGVVGSTGTSGAFNEADITKDYVANINWLKGTHNIRGGVELIWQDESNIQGQANNETYPAASGGFDFSQGATQLNGGPAGNDFNAFASFLLGLPSVAGKVYQFSPGGVLHTAAHSFSAYLRDQWQVTPRLTVTYGLRSEYFPDGSRVTRGLETYDFSTGNVLLCGIGSNSSECGGGRGNLRFMPRLGLAYRPTGSFVIRAGFGMAINPINFAAMVWHNFPDIDGLQLVAPNGFSYATTLRTGLPIPPTPNFSSSAISIPSYISVSSLDPQNTLRGYIETWNFTLEKKLKDWTGSAAYVATRSVDSMANLDQNYSPIGTGVAGQILNQEFGRTAVTTIAGTVGTIKYDSLQVRVQHPFTKGIQISSSYTLAHGTTPTAGGNTGGIAGSGAISGVAVPYLYRLNIGNLPTGIEDNFQTVAIVELPFGKDRHWVKNGLASQIWGGWQINGLFSAMTGLPFSVTGSGSSLNSIASTQRGDCLGTPQLLNSIYQWYGTSTFAQPTGARYGTCGPNNIFGPGLINLDTSIQRVWAFKERFQLKFRADMFNAANTPHHAVPNGAVNTGAFMQALGIANTGRDGIDQRQFRFGLRLGF